MFLGRLEALCPIRCDSQLVCPQSADSTLSVVETAIETVLGVALLLGVYQRIAAWLQRWPVAFVCFDHERRAGRRRAFELFGVHGIRRHVPSRGGCSPTDQ